MQRVKEEITKLNVFGKHPGYRKKPMSVPDNLDSTNGMRDWDDDSAKGEKPFGLKIGSSSPYDKIVNIITDEVIRSLNEGIDEKNFLKLPNQPQPAPMPEPAPMPAPMPGADPNAGPMPPMQGGDVPPMSPDMGGQPNPFDGNFDAGVQADEDTDPETYIQQLTGKLTQVMRDYSKQEGNNSADLDKYVLGMVIKQCVKSMDESDRKAMIKKIKETPLPGEENTEEEMDAMNPDEEPMPEPAPEQPQPVAERRIKMTKKQAMQLMESLNDDSQRDAKEQKPKDAEYNKRTNPFNAPQFK